MKSPRPRKPSDLLSKAEIIRALRRYRYDPAMNRGLNNRDIPIGSVLAAAGLRNEGLYKSTILFTGKLSARQHRLLSPVIRRIEAGELSFRRQKPPGPGHLWRGVEVVQEINNPPAGPAPRLDKLSTAGDWRPFARCRNCGGRAWQSLVIRDGYHYACKSCIPSWQWPGMGARATTNAERLGLPESTMREDFSLAN